MAKPTARQQAAIDEPGDLLVVAGPGSGKTATMVKRIARILQDPSRRAVAVTFTRDGARELGERLGHFLPREAVGRVQIGTFHSLTIQHLKACRRTVKLATPAQQREFLRRAIQASNAPGDLAELQLAFENIKSSLRPEAQPLANSDWYTSYQSALERHGLIDLFDVMRIAVQEFRAGTLPVLPCTDIIVDEAQDNDELQAYWVGAHAKATVTMVGDDDQAIFEWRRAIGFPGMLAFQKARSAKVVLLEDNFRSHTEIVEAAGAVIRHNDPYRNKKALVARKGRGGEVVRVVAGSTLATCQAIAQLLEGHLIDLRSVPTAGPATAFDFGVETGSWAVLARTNALLDVAEAELTAAGVKSFRNTGSIWSTQPAQIALQFMRSLYSTETVGLEIAMHHAGMSQDEIGPSLESYAALHGGLRERLSGLAADLESRHSATEFSGLMRRCIPLLDGDDEVARVGKVVSNFVVSNLARERRTSAESILAAMCSELRRPGARPLARIERMLNDNGRRSADHAVMLYTMHGSKGLEFENVVIIGADAETIPGTAVDAPPGSDQIRPGESTLQSERRLFYVAMTRAKRRLYIAHSFAKPSPFVLELPADIKVISAG